MPASEPTTGIRGGAAAAVAVMTFLLALVAEPVTARLPIPTLTPSSSTEPRPVPAHPVADQGGEPSA